MKNQANNKIHALYCKSAVKNDAAIEGRKKKLLEYANKKGFKNHRFYIDNGYSGATLDRPDMKRLMAEIENGLVASVTTTDISNLSRNMADLSMLEKYFADHDVEYTNLEELDENGQKIDSKIDVRSLFHEWYKKHAIEAEEYPACSACHQQMKPYCGCKISHIVIDGKKYERIKAGDERHAANADTTDDVTCPECNVGMGQYHHWECGVEECPVCHDYIQQCGNITKLCYNKNGECGQVA